MLTPELYEYWRSGAWITFGVHVYAMLVLFCCLFVYWINILRTSTLSDRVTTIMGMLEGRALAARIPGNSLAGIILNLEDRIERDPNVSIIPILDYLRKEDRNRKLQVSTLVNVTETAIEIFPMIGIVGTVWGISAITQKDIEGDNILFLFASATSATLHALLYAIFFRLVYSAIVHDKIAIYRDSHEKYEKFLSYLDRRSLASIQTIPVPMPAIAVQAPPRHQHQCWRVCQHNRQSTTRLGKTVCPTCHPMQREACDEAIQYPPIRRRYDPHG